MKILTSWLMAGAMTAALMPAAAAAQGAYKAPILSDGHPDISGFWGNATITPLERPAQFGTRLTLTREEVAKAEGDRAAVVTNGNRSTDPNSGVIDQTVPCDLRGFTGAGCGYNTGWTDPGDVAVRVAGQPRTSIITSTPDGRMPARVTGAPAARGGGGGEGGEDGRGGGGGGRGGGAAPQAATVQQAAARPDPRNDNPETRSLGERCLTSFGNSWGPVMLPQLYNNNYNIVQTKDAVAINVEMVHDNRIVRLNDKHRTDGVRPWHGDSIGWWEGDTLVVETVGYHPSQNFRGASANLKVTERFRRVAADRLLYQFKVEDPTVWTQSWGGEYEFYRSPGVYEYACHEGNYGLEGILAGARTEEAESRQAAAGRPAGTQ